MRVLFLCWLKQKTTRKYGPSAAYLGDLLLDYFDKGHHLENNNV